MSKLLINESKLTAFGDKIRAVEGSTGLIPVTEMAGRIGALPAGEGVYAWKRTDVSGNVDYVTSDNENEYPESGSLDGYVYEKVVAIVVRDPGLYDANGNNTSWDDLVSSGVITVSGTTITAANTSLSGDLVIPDGVLTIDSSVFRNCTSLTSVLIPDSVTTINGLAFYNCTGLTNITLSQNLTKLDGNSFSNCTSLTSIIIPKSVVKFSIPAMSGCTNLESVYFEHEDATTIQSSFHVDVFNKTSGVQTTFYFKNEAVANKFNAVNTMGGLNGIKSTNYNW